MPLFQNYVLTKYLQAQKKESIANTWNEFKSHFMNPRIRYQIRGLKEEQHQGKLMEDLFIKM